MIQTLFDQISEIAPIIYIHANNECVPPPIDFDLSLINYIHSGAYTLGFVKATQEQINAAIILLPKEVTFDMSIRTPAVYAADYFVSSPRVKDDPLEAIRDAINEAVKKDKSIAFIVLSLAKGMIYLLDYIDKTDKRLKDAKVK
jgi:hypothetical protein